MNVFPFFSHFDLVYFCNVKILKWIFYLIALFGFIWFVFFRFSNNEQEPKTDILIQDELEVFDSIQNEDWTESDSLIWEDEMVVDQDQYVMDDEYFENNNEILQGNHIVIVGSFAKEDYANKFLERILKLGIEGGILFEEPYFKVMAGTFQVKEDALARVNELNNNYQLSAFVYSKN
jgi:hypothetical protein